MNRTNDVLFFMMAYGLARIFFEAIKSDNRLSPANQLCQKIRATSRDGWRQAQITRVLESVNAKSAMVSCARSEETIAYVDAPGLWPRRSSTR